LIVKMSPPPKRKAEEIAVPAKGKDPAERKRVLNVLAQRRYREKRKQHVKSLEKQAVKSKEESTSPATDTSQSMPTNDFSPSAAPEHLTPDAYQGQLFEDPFSFDPNFVAFPTDLAWDTLPSLSNSPISTTDDLSLTLSTPDSRHSFPDEAHLEVLELNLLRGATEIARRLNVDQLIWSLTSTSPFTDPSMALANFGHLPPNLRPTKLQMTEPHHPVIDLMPWPTVRDKLILIFTQPPDIRPKSAASPTALLDFVYDLEDSSEGVRIWGDDPSSDQAWEVGEKVFKNWWWAFDRDVIKRSNELRSGRGARLLGMGEGAVLGEIS
jgi:hypothetical protein